MTRDSTTALTPREAAILLALLAQEQPISNTALRDRFGFTVVGKERVRLNDLGLVESGKVPGHGNALFHEVTDAGWARGRHELAPRAEPVKLTVPVGVLFAIAEGVHRFLEREDREIGEVLGVIDAPIDPPRPDSPPAADPTPAPAPAPAPQNDPLPVTDHAPAADQEHTAEDCASALEAAIRTAYTRLAPAAQDWVRLADVRPLLPTAAKTQVDRVLRRMARQPDVRVVPDENQKSLTAADHAAAVRIGEHDNHLLLIGSA